MKNIDLSDCLQHSEHVIAQLTGQDMVLFHLESGSYYSLNELGARIWELCNGHRPIIDVADQIETEYDAPRELILNDCRALICKLLENSLLVRLSGSEGASD